MSSHIKIEGSSAVQEPVTSFHYPWAGAPDIIRSGQKDAYFQSVLLGQLSIIIRSLYGARTAHNWTSEARTFTELLYLTLTTFVGNRTLGEEYCDIVQVEDDTHALPALVRRSGYIVSSVLVPYALSHTLPAFRRRVRANLEQSLRRRHYSKTMTPSAELLPLSRTYQIQEYFLKHLDSITSPAPLYALSLAIFYFTGAYYQISKRLFGLRYIFTRKVPPSDQRIGYEVLGVLLVLQMLVQAYIQLHYTFTQVENLSIPSNNAVATGGNAIIDGNVELSTNTTISTPLLFEAAPSADPAAQRARLSKMTHTPLPKPHHFDLKNPKVMPWIAGKQQRKCTLCLEPMKDPSLTTCGHVFCWACVTDWLTEQPLCPLCRQSALVQHVLPLRR